MDARAHEPGIIAAHAVGDVLRVMVRVLVFVLAFAAVVLGLVATSLDIPFVRRLVAHRINLLLEPGFRGRIQVDQIGHLDLFGVAKTDVTVFDPAGAPVLTARGVDVSVATWAAARSALFGGKAPLSIRLGSVSVDDLDVRLDANPRGGLAVADAFEPTKPTASNPNDRGLRFEVSKLVMKHARAHGAISGAPPLDIVADHVVGSFLLTPDAIEGEVADAAITARGIAAKKDVSGTLAAHAKRASAPPFAVNGRLEWHGLAGGIEHSIRATVAGARVDAVVDAPHAEPAALRSMWAGSGFDQVASMHAEAHGILPAVELGVRASFGQGTFELTARGVVAGDRHASVRFESKGIDVHQFIAASPASRLDARGDIAAGQTADGALDGSATVDVLPGSIGAYGVPPAWLAANVARTTSGEWTGSASLSTGRPAFPTRIEASLAPHGASSRVDFELRSAAPNLDAVPELRHAVQGGARLLVQGSLDTDSMALDARVHGRGDHLVQGATRADAVSIDADARGPLANPRVDVAVRGEKVLAGGKLLSRVGVTARGRLMTPNVDATLRGPELPDVDASGNLSLVGGLSARDVRLAVAHAGEQAQMTADRIDVGPDSFTIDRMVVHGVGAPMVIAVSMAAGALRVRGSTSGLDLGRVGRAAALERTLRAGTLSFGIDADVRRASATGHAKLDLVGAGLGSVSDITAHLIATMKGRSLSGTLHAEGGAIGSLDVDASEVEAGGRAALLSTSWRRLWGRIGVEARGDIGKAMALLPPDAVPLDEARGRVVIRGHVARVGPFDSHPDLDLALSTDQLVLSPRTKITHDIDGVLVMERPKWRLEGIDFDAHGAIDGRSGRIQLDTEARDRKGEIMRLRAASDRFPYQDLLGTVGRLPADLQSTPIDIDATMPERGLGGLPDLLKQNYVTGRLAFGVKLRGTVRSPDIDVVATLKRSHFENDSRNEFIDFDLGAHYDGSHATSSLKGRIDGKEVITLDSEANLAIGRIMDSGAQASWRASARGRFDRFPLEAIPAVDEKLISGDLSGDFTLANLHEDAQVNANLTVSSLKMGTYTYKSAALNLKADGQSLDGRVRIEQTDGFAEAKAHAAMTWGASLAPLLSATRPVDLALAARSFRIAALSTLAEGTFDELDGKLDADTHVELDPVTRGPKVSGTLALSQGLFEASAGGGELHDVAAKIRFAPGTVTLEKLSASGLTGHVEATGSARIDNMQLQSAAAVVIVPPGHPIPVSAGGAEIGNVDGRFDIGVKSLELAGAMAITIDVPHVRFALPNGATTNAISLGAMNRVRVGAHRGHPATFVLLPMDPTDAVDDQPPSRPSSSLRIDAHIRDAQVVRGSDVNIDLTGNVQVAGAPAEVTGKIDLKKGGSLVLQGKTFTIESGTVTMIGPDPSNPQVVVKAGWVAPDATTVFATFVGPLKTGKVTLTSEPPLSQEEIVQLLMFGTVDGQQTQNPSADPTLSAVSTVGGEAAQPLNHMLNQLGLGAVSVKVDANQSSTPKPEVAVRLARDISIQIAVVLGQPPPGVNPDTYLLTMDWRFLSRWSFSATVGDAGTKIFDLLWHKRY